MTAFRFLVYLCLGTGVCVRVDFKNSFLSQHGRTRTNQDGLTVEVLSIRFNETDTPLKTGLYGFAPKRFVGSNPMNRESKADRILKSLRAKVSRMFPTTYGLTPKHCGTRGLIWRGDKESRAIARDMSQNGEKKMIDND